MSPFSIAFETNGQPANEKLSLYKNIQDNKVFSGCTITEHNDVVIFTVPQANEENNQELFESLIDLVKNFASMKPHFTEREDVK